MDSYLECLMRYIEEQRVGELVHGSKRYRKASGEASRLYDALTAQLTEAQVGTLDALCDARSTMYDEEGRALFREGVALGKWMLRA